MSPGDIAAALAVLRDLRERLDRRLVDEEYRPYQDPAPELCRVDDLSWIVTMVESGAAFSEEGLAEELLPVAEGMVSRAEADALDLVASYAREVRQEWKPRIIEDIKTAGVAAVDAKIEELREEFPDDYTVKVLWRVSQEWEVRYGPTPTRKRPRIEATPPAFVAPTGARGGRRPRSRESRATRRRSTRTAAGSPARPSDGGGDDPPLTVGAPALHLILQLEGRPRLYLEARSESDELRLRAWLRAVVPIDGIVAAITAALDEGTIV